MCTYLEQDAKMDIKLIIEIKFALLSTALPSLSTQPSITSMLIQFDHNIGHYFFYIIEADYDSDARSF